MYHKARKDFDNTPVKTIERTKSAKFLRDTTENCLAYIASKQARSPKVEATCDERLLKELRATLEETIAIAERGSGGKKRRFDENWDSVPQGPAKMRGSHPLVNSDPVPRGRISKPKLKPTTSWTQDLDAAERRRGRESHTEPTNSTGLAYGDRYVRIFRSLSLSSRFGPERED